MKWKLLLAAAVFCSCGPDAKNNTAANAPAKDGSNQISFKVNGEPVVTSGWNISRFDMGQGPCLNITTDMHVDKRTLLINLQGTEPGTYQLKRGQKGSFTGYGDYKPDYDNLLDSYSFEEGSFTITSIDTAKGILNASFSGTAKKGDKTFTISEGSIVNGNLARGIHTY